MKKLILVIGVILALNAHQSWAQGKLHIVRFPAASENAGRFRRIEFPQGFSIEYSYNDAGQISKKKLVNFLGIKHPECASRKPCTVTVAASESLFDTAISDEVLFLKSGPIPPLSRVLLDFSNNDQAQALQSLMDIWRLVTQGYLQIVTPNTSNLPPDQYRAKIQEKYAPAVHQIMASLAVAPSASAQAALIYNDMFLKMPTLEKADGEKQMRPTSSLNETEKKLLQKNIENIGLCSSKFKKNISNLISKKLIMRERIIDEAGLELIRTKQNEHKLDIMQTPDRGTGVAFDKTWRAQLDQKQRDVIFENIRKVSQIGEVIFSPGYIYQDLPPIIVITDRMMMNYPNHIFDLMFSNTKLLSEYFGDATFNAEVELNHFQYGFELVLMHEYMHTQQQKLWRAIEMEKRFQLARLAVRLNSSSGEKIMSKELSNKIKERLIQPAHEVMEMAATYDALDRVACLR